MYNYEMFGDILYELRKERKMTQKQLSIATGLAPATISSLENNKILPGRNTVKKIAEVLCVPEETFHK